MGICTTRPFPQTILGKSVQTASMRRSIDDYPFQETDYPPNYEDDELTPISWAVGISDDYADAEPRVMLTVEEVGRPVEDVGRAEEEVGRAVEEVGLAVKEFGVAVEEVGGALDEFGRWPWPR